MFSKKCEHVFGEVDSKGYQYCEKCGKANLVGLPECKHNWKILDKYTTENTFTRNIFKFTYIQQCTNCGELRKFDTN